MTRAAADAQTMVFRALLACFLAGLAVTSAADEDHSAAIVLYKTKCQACHMADGNSPLEPLNFTDAKWTHGSTPEEIKRVISEGVAGTAMLPFKSQLSPEEIAQLAAYVRSFDKSLKPTKAKEQ